MVSPEADKIIEQLKRDVMQALQRSADDKQSAHLGVSALARRLGLDANIVRNTLVLLQNEGKVEQDGKMWRANGYSMLPVANDETVIDYLTRSVSKDSEKGGDGIRGTDEVANYLGVPTAQALRILNRLCEDGKVDFFGAIEGCGSVHHWRIAEELTSKPKL